MATTTTEQKAERAVWQIDPQHSVIELSVKHMMFTTVKGRFSAVRGTIVADDVDPSRSSVQVEIEARSIDTRVDQRDTHLRSADFLDVENYPTITFTSKRVEPLTKERLRVIGDLTIRGTTREVVLDTTFNGRAINPYGKEVAGFTSETSIVRQDYGLVWNVGLEAGGFLVGDTVKILIEVQAVKQS